MKPQAILVEYSDKTEGEGAVIDGKRFTTHTYVLDGSPVRAGEHIEILSTNGVFIPAVVFAHDIARGLTVGIPITTLYGIEMLRMVVIPGGTLARRVKE